MVVVMVVVVVVVVVGGVVTSPGAMLDSRVFFANARQPRPGPQFVGDVTGWDGLSLPGPGTQAHDQCAHFECRSP